MTGEPLKAARMTRNGHHGLHGRIVRRGHSIALFGEPAAPMLVCLIGGGAIPSEEFHSFTIPVDQPDEMIRRQFQSEVADFDDGLPHPKTR